MVSQEPANRELQALIASQNLAVTVLPWLVSAYNQGQGDQHGEVLSKYFACQIWLYAMVHVSNSQHITEFSLECLLHFWCP